MKLTGIPCSNEGPSVEVAIRDHKPGKPPLAYFLADLHVKIPCRASFGYSTTFESFRRS